MAKSKGKNGTFARSSTTTNTNGSTASSSSTTTQQTSPEDDSVLLTSTMSSSTAVATNHLEGTDHDDDDNDELVTSTSTIIKTAWTTADQTLQGRHDLPRLLWAATYGTIRQCYLEWNHFFYSQTSNTSIGGILRIAYGCVALFNTAHLFWLDFDLYFVKLLPIDTGMDSFGDDAISTKRIDSIFFDVPYDQEEYYLRLAVQIWLIQLILLIVGICPRVNAIGNFFWHVQFHKHNDIMYDGSDIMIRLLAFFIIFLPLHRHTIWDVMIGGWRWLRNNNKGARMDDSTRTPLDTWPMWPFRLIQIEMCLQFFSCVMVKWAGPMWRDGSAMYYVVHVDDFFGTGLVAPNILFGYINSLKLLTYMTLVIETLAPITIWIPSTRLPTLIFLITFHIAIDLSMNLNMFHWIMVVGWCSFIAQPMTSDEYRSAVEKEEQNKAAVMKKDKEGEEESLAAAATRSGSNGHVDGRNKESTLVGSETNKTTEKKARFNNGDGGDSGEKKGQAPTTRRGGKGKKKKQL